MALELEGGKKKHRPDKKQLIMVGGTVILVVLAYLQLRKTSATSASSGTSPTATYTGSSADGTVSGGSTGSTGSTDAQATQSLLQSFTDTLNSTLSGFTAQQQANQDALQSEVDGLTASQDALTSVASSLSDLINSKVTDLGHLSDPIPVVADPNTNTAPKNTGVPSGENPTSVVPSAGAGKSGSTYGNGAAVTLNIKAGQNWTDVSRETGLTLDQLRTYNGGSLGALGVGSKTVKVG